MSDISHPFDDAIALAAEAPNLFLSQTSEAYWNAISPYGGVTTAIILEAIMRHPDRIGDPIAITVNFAGPIQRGGMSIRVRPARTNRSTQHWQVELTQAGDSQVLITATAVFAIRRTTWRDTESKMPAIPGPSNFSRFQMGKALPFLERYDIRYVDGAPFAKGERSMTQCWISDVPLRKLDFASVASFCDSFIPRLFVRKGASSPVSTVSLSINFHIDGALLADVNGKFVFGQASANGFHDGYYDQEGKLWSEDGRLLATTHQMVWFKD